MTGILEVAGKRTFLLWLLCGCCAAHAQSWVELASLEFEAAPIPGDPSAPDPRLSGESEPRPARAADSARSNPTPEARSFSSLTEAIAELSEAILTEEAEKGPYSPTLTEDFLSLAALYEESGQYLLSIGALGRAQQVSRVNNGLFSLDQVDIVEEILANGLAADDYSEFDSLQRYLVDLANRNPDDPRSATVLNDVGDRYVQAFEHYVATPTEPQLTVNVNVNMGIGPPLPGDFDRPLTSKDRARMALVWARMSYNRATHAALRTDAYDVGDLLGLEDKIIETYYLTLTHPKLLGDGRIQPLRGGEAVLKAQIENSSNFEDSPVAVARAIVELADWHLIYSRNGTALDEYQSAYDLLTSTLADEAAIAALLSPELPVALPDFSDHTRGETGYLGYIDAAVEFNRYGSVTDVEILDRSPEASKSIERRLRRRIYQSRFRPRFVGGDLLRSDAFMARYYFRY